MKNNSKLSLKQSIINELKNNWLLILLIAVSLGLLIAAFIIPPPAFIDSSVLKAVAEIIGMMALWVFSSAIHKGLDARFKHGNTSLTIGSLEGDNKMEDEDDEEK